MKDSEPSEQQAPRSGVQALRPYIESVLLVTDAPVTVEQLARVLDDDAATIATVLTEMSAEFTQQGSGFDLRETAEGWRLYTRPEYADVVEAFILDGNHTRLSRAALETLAVVAYRQPVTRSQVSAVRGVNVDGVMRTLQLRGLIKEVDVDTSTGAHLYATTEMLVEQLGIESLDQLPDLAPLLPDVESIEEEY